MPFGVDEAVLGAILAAIAEGTATIAAPTAAGAGTAAGAAGAGTAAAAAPIAAGGWGATLGGGLEAAAAPATSTLPAAISATELGNVGAAQASGSVGAGASQLPQAMPIGGVPPGGTTYPGTNPTAWQQLQAYLPESMGGAPSAGPSTGTKTPPAPPGQAPTLPQPNAKAQSMMNPLGDQTTAQMLSLFMGKKPPAAPQPSLPPEQKAPYAGPTAQAFMKKKRQGY